MMNLSFVRHVSAHNEAHLLLLRFGNLCFSLCAPVPGTSTQGIGEPFQHLSLWKFLTSCGKCALLPY